jgi:hypothetical protein
MRLCVQLWPDTQKQGARPQLANGIAPMLCVYMSFATALKKIVWQAHHEPLMRMCEKLADFHEFLRTLQKQARNRLCPFLEQPDAIAPDSA